MQVAVVDARNAARRQLVASTDETRARSVLEAAVAVAERHYEKQVTLEWRAASEKIDVRLTHAGKVARKPLEIAVVASRHCDLMSHSAGRERAEREIADLHRMIDQLVVA